MNYLSQYIVPFNGLDNKENQFDFVVTDEFFDCFEENTIKGGNIDVSLLLLKKSNSLHLKIHLKGSVKLICDRCLELYEQSIDFMDTIVAEYGEETNFDTNSESVTLEKGKTEINIAQFIYEFAHFGLPLQHYHPDTELGQPGCSKEMLDILNQHLVDEEQEVIDPRWEKLKEIKKDNK